jgi:hypothetical protein
MNLWDVRNRVYEDKKRKEDYLVQVKDINFDEDSGEIIIDGSERLPDGTKGNRIEGMFPATDQAEGQFYSRIGIPSSYAKRTPTNLIKPNIDYWKEQIDPETEMLVRTIHDGSKQYIRSFLSNRYGILDNDTVIDNLMETFDPHHIQVRDFQQDAYGNMMNLRLTDDRFVEYGIDPTGNSNPYYGGVHVINGETGNYSVTMSVIIWEQWCTNGAVRQRFGESLMRKKHIGDSSALQEQFESASNFAPELYERSITSFKKAREEIVVNPMLALFYLMKSNKRIFNDKMQVNVLKSFELRKEETRYGIASAITQGAQQSSYEKRIDAEKLAGDILFFDKPVYFPESANMDRMKNEIDKLTFDQEIDL